LGNSGGVDGADGSGWFFSFSEEGEEEGDGDEEEPGEEGEGVGEEGADEEAGFGPEGA
jgi:hypothetical protein